MADIYACRVTILPQTVLNTIVVMADVHFGQWNSKSDFASGMGAGLPLTVFDKAMENTIVISPFREFMATSSHLDTSSDPHVLQLGVFGLADQVISLKLGYRSYNYI